MSAAGVRRGQHRARQRGASPGSQGRAGEPEHHAEDHVRGYHARARSFETACDRRVPGRADHHAAVLVHGRDQAWRAGGQGGHGVAAIPGRTLRPHSTQTAC